MLLYPAMIATAAEAGPHTTLFGNLYQHEKDRNPLLEKVEYDVIFHTTRYHVTTNGQRSLSN